MGVVEGVEWQVARVVLEKRPDLVCPPSELGGNECPRGLRS